MFVINLVVIHLAQFQPILSRISRATASDPHKRKFKQFAFLGPVNVIASQFGLGYFRLLGVYSEKRDLVVH